VFLPFTSRPVTHCSIKPYPALVWAGGPVASIIEWLISAVVIKRLLDAGKRRSGTLVKLEGGLIGPVKLK
jgi:hypothetical protein